MLLRTNMKKHISILFFMCVFLFNFPVFAAVKEFVREYSYQAMEIDTKETCRIISLEQVKRLILEEIGTYIESFSEVTNYQLTKDKIITMTGGIVRTNIVEEKWDGKIYWLRARVVADPDHVVTAIGNLRADRQKMQELENATIMAKAMAGEIANLRKELQTSKPDQYEIAKYNEIVKGLSATDWFQKGMSFYLSGRFRAAIDALNKAVALNGTYASAYHDRGCIYIELGDFKEGLRDLNKAIELNPKNANAYYNRGVAYQKFGKKEESIREYNKAIELDEKLFVAYNNRGLIYASLKNYKQAMSDFNKTIELNEGWSLLYSIYYVFYMRYRSSVHKIEKKQKLVDEYRKQKKGLDVSFPLHPDRFQREQAFENIKHWLHCDLS